MNFIDSGSYEQILSGCIGRCPGRVNFDTIGGGPRWVSFVCIGRGPGQVSFDCNDGSPGWVKCVCIGRSPG